MRHREFNIPGLGGLDLHARAWLTDHNAPHAVVIVAHGLGEHCGRYAGLAGQFVASGRAVYAIDHRGHGRSAGPRANIDRFAHLVSDFCSFAGHAMRQHPGVPAFLLGHSMGGAVAFASALRLQDRLAGLILSAPALATDQRGGPLQLKAARLLSVLAPNTGVMTLDATAVSRDPVVVHDYIADPLVHHQAIPARTVVELLNAMDGFPETAPRVRLSTLILHGTADRLIPLTATRAVYQLMGAKDRTLKLYEGLFHELFNEPERDQVVGDVLRWLDR